MMLFAFVFDTPVGIARGIWRLILHPDALITDYSAVGGFGATSAMYAVRDTLGAIYATVLVTAVVYWVANLIFNKNYQKKAA